jgi:hypothetical protein
MNDRSRPGEGGSETTTNDGVKAILSPVAPLDEIAHHVDGTFVLVVKVTGGKYRRRCFLSSASAEKAARNALEAGHNATVYLAELKPLWKLAGGDRR